LPDISPFRQLTTINIDSKVAAPKAKIILLLLRKKVPHVLSEVEATTFETFGIKFFATMAPASLSAVRKAGTAATAEKIIVAPPIEFESISFCSLAV